MNICVFTSNQPRHLSLLESLSKIADTVYAVQECNTVFPGKIKDFYENSSIMRTYFEQVIQSEHNVFGELRFLPSNVRTIAAKDGDLSSIPLDFLRPALECDYHIVFGASYIRAPLIDELIKLRAINIHMGISPYYRGSSCNFWALYDGSPDMVGATIHLLSRGLDSGDMLYHALPKAEACTSFDLGMLAVKAAHDSLLQRIQSGKIAGYRAVMQDKTHEIRYTRNKDFTDEAAEEYLSRQLNPQEIFSALRSRDLGRYHRPFIPE